MIGASVCPMKMFAETARDSAPEIRSSFVMTTAKTWTTFCMTPR